ncbi:MAG TPA: SAV_915 family protein [Streptosporangiaceae bacterium]|nr:SAV_915 family protein [Streptosporangiaceae bacterium]
MERELVIAPACSGRDETVLQVRRLPDGTRTLVLFSSVARLMEELGPDQQWVCVPLDAATVAARHASVDRVSLDPVLR